MKIAHVCLSNFYIDGFGYQENMLTSMHKRMGHEVTIVASTETYIEKTKIGYVEPGSYTNEHGITVHRLPYHRRVPKKLQAKVRAYEGLERVLEMFKPDLIFVHDVQFWDFITIKRYVRRRSVCVFADCHTDYVNSARSFFSRHILHGIFYKFIVRYVDDIVRVYFPTLPARGVFLNEVYGLSPSKMELLPFGADDDLTSGQDRARVRAEMRGRLGIPGEALTFVTGGKLDLRKNIHVLIDRFSRAKRRGLLGEARLIVFGSPTPEVRAELDRVDIHPHVLMAGWTAPDEIYRMFWSADLALFPGTHSVLWEEAVGHGLGAVFHRWQGMDHLDLGGNARFIDDASPDAIDRLLHELVADNAAEVRQLNLEAAAKGPEAFAMSAIAAKSLAPTQGQGGR